MLVHLPISVVLPLIQLSRWLSYVKKIPFRVVVNGETFLGDQNLFFVRGLGRNSGGRVLHRIFFFSFFNAAKLGI